VVLVAVLVVLIVLVVLVILVVLIVGVSRRRRVAHDGDEAPVDQPSGNVLEDIRGHVASCLGVATFADELWNRRRGRSSEIGRPPVACPGPPRGYSPLPP